MCLKADGCMAPVSTMTLPEILDSLLAVSMMVSVPWVMMMWRCGLALTLRTISRRSFSVISRLSLASKGSIS